MVLAVNRRSHFIDLLGELTRLFLADLTQEQLNTVILKYQPVIRSNRVASYISNIGDLFQVLEARNELGEGNVEILKEICEFLQKPYAHHRVEVYKRLIIPSVPPAAVAQPILLPAATVASTDFPYTLQRVINIIAENIGTGWRELGRNLGVREQDIVQINTRCCNDLTQSATQVLKAYWDQYPRANHVNEIKEAIRRMNRMALLRKINEVLNNIQSNNM